MTAIPVPEALIFDMDGLLVDSEPASDLAMEQFLARRMLAFDPDLMERLLGRRLPEALAIVKDWFDLEEDVLAITNEFADLRVAALRAHLPVMPGAAEIVRWGKAAGLRVGLATSGMREHADVSIAAAGLTGEFHAEATGTEVDRGKPAPDLFLLAASRLGVDPARCMVFEDAPAGVMAAKAAGMTAVWIPNAHSADLPMPVAPDITFATLVLAREWLAKLWSARSSS
jgi:HAD superfamily hydrolase (TIGR01509 family)